jgi:dTDP-4-amino-4,6-dideoxygalactose transaminase
MVNYNPWPNGKVPKHLRRPELQQIKEAGYVYDDPREVITLFEKKVSEFAGAKYAVAVDCCTHAMELCFRYLIHWGVLNPTKDIIRIPERTYVSVPMMLQQLGFKVDTVNMKWSGCYPFLCDKSIGIFDAAVLWRENMYLEDTLFCLSFQIKKRIPIGRGGMVLTDNKNVADWIRLASYDGRDLTLPYDHPDHIKMNGFHYYMTPEDAARGILLMDAIKEEGITGGYENYPDIRKMIKL